MNRHNKPGRHAVRVAEEHLGRSISCPLPAPPQSMLLLQQVGLMWKQMLTDMHDILLPARLTPVTYTALLALYMAPDSVLTPSDLAARTGESQTNTSRVCTELERLMLIARSRSANDRRNIELRLTESGVRLMEALLQRLYAQAERRFAHLTQAEKCRLQQLQEKVLAHVPRQA